MWTLMEKFMQSLVMECYTKYYVDSGLCLWFRTQKGTQN